MCVSPIRSLCTALVVKAVQHGIVLYTYKINVEFVYQVASSECERANNPKPNQMSK